MAYLAATLLIFAALLRGVCSADQAVYNPKWPIRLTATYGSTTAVLLSQCGNCPIHLAVFRRGAATHLLVHPANLGAPIRLRIVIRGSPLQSDGQRGLHTTSRCSI